MICGLNRPTSSRKLTEMIKDSDQQTRRRKFCPPRSQKSQPTLDTAMGQTMTTSSTTKVTHTKMQRNKKTATRKCVSSASKKDTLLETATLARNQRRYKLKHSSMQCLQTELYQEADAHTG